LRAKGVFYHPNHLRRLWERGDFPKPFKPSPRHLAWFEDQIDAWLAEKARTTADR
jgi:predicted DNA-binding transcriptional regulator AlpA